MAADEDADTAPADPRSAGAAVTRSAARSRRVAGRRSRPTPAQSAAVGATAVGAESGAVPAPGGAGARRKPRAGRDLPAAIGVGVGLAAVIVASLFLYRPSFAVLVGLAVVYGSYELSRALAGGGTRVSLTPIVVGGVAMLVSAWTRGPNGLVVALLLTVCGVVVWRIADGAQHFTRDVIASVMIVLYLPTLAGFAVLLVHPDDGAARIIAFVATVVCSDTGGYATGVLFGRHPLAPIVSKGKTWEGFAGSVLFCTAAGVLFMTLTFHEAWWKGALFGLAVVVTATLGDLGESMIKRDLDIKDMGNLLPGHGGIMDRLDSLLPCAAVSYLILSGFVPVA